MLSRQGCGHEIKLENLKVSQALSIASCSLAGTRFLFVSRCQILSSSLYYLDPQFFSADHPKAGPTTFTTPKPLPGYCSFSCSERNIARRFHLKNIPVFFSMCVFFREYLSSYSAILRKKKR